MNQLPYIPEGYQALTAAINMPGAAAALDWYKTVFNAQEKIRLIDKSGMVVHAEIEIDGTRIMIAEEHPDYNRSPKTLGGTTVVFSLYVANPDETITKSVAAGAKLIAAASDQFYGDRAGRIEDPFGYKWIIGTPIRKVSAEEMQKMIDDQPGT